MLILSFFCSGDLELIPRTLGKGECEGDELYVVSLLHKNINQCYFLFFL